MIFDSDILIWLSRGNTKAAKLIDGAPERFVSILTRMEVLQGARDRAHLAQMNVFFKEYDFVVLPLTENIGHRALIYIEEFSLSHGLRATDAIIAATAAENNLSLASGNIKHYKAIKDLKFRPFHP